MSKMPVVFVGHGSPMNAIEDNIYSKTCKQHWGQTYTFDKMWITWHCWAIVKSLGSDIHENYIGVRLTQLTKTTYSSHVFCYGRLQCTLMYLLNVALSPFLIAFRYTSIMQ